MRALTVSAQRYTSAIMAAKTPTQRKAGRKNKGILIRVTAAQKHVLAKTAKSTGLGLSSWMLSIALRAAQKMKSA
jgi:uncharacterized protein (DUF1778 family)